MASRKRDRGQELGKINKNIDTQKSIEQSKSNASRDRIKRDQRALAEQKPRARRPKTSEISKLESATNSDLVEVNRQEASLMRVLELERREKITNLGTSYVPAFDGIVQANYRGLDNSGNHHAAYGGKSYKVVSLGATSIPKGTLVQLWFSGNSYYIDW